MTKVTDVLKFFFPCDHIDTFPKVSLISLGTRSLKLLIMPDFVK